MKNNQKFTFEISLSVLNHLGRNLYRSFATVLGEAISNSWDAKAQNVWIYINKENNTFLIKDDGDGMNAEDFQNKFLKIGYSKRKDGTTETSTGRPYIGRKGIGKLALLSCANKVTVISKTPTSDYTGGTINNSGLDAAIQDDLKPSEYPLEKISAPTLPEYRKGHTQGTIIFFDDLNYEIKNRIEHIKKIIALSFRFSILDDTFNIFVNDEAVTMASLKDLAENTEFVWGFNQIKDPYIDEYVKSKEPIKMLKMEGNIHGFIASVEKPSHLKIRDTDEKLSIDLFVNGRLREKDILKHISNARVPLSYLYGQIHADDFDDEKDRFTSAREGIIAEDPRFKTFLNHLKPQISIILSNWDDWRIKNKNEGDPHNTKRSPKERASRTLFNSTAADYSEKTKSKKEKTPREKKIDSWIDDLEQEAQFNFPAYADCFLSENLIRNYIKDTDIALSPEATTRAKDMQTREQEIKDQVNISIDILKTPTDINYLSMDDLANLVDKQDKSKTPAAALSRSAVEYKPMRNALMHTAILTDPAKMRLSAVYENIKARLITLLK